MTIAACYVSSEGVVLGADSTATFLTRGSLENGIQTYNYTQKVFEVGESGSTLGFVSSGLQGIGDESFRTMLADLSDRLIANPPASVEEAANSWRDMFWSAFTEKFSYPMQRCKDLESRPARTNDEEAERQRLLQVFTGTCVLGGRVAASRTPHACFFQYGPLQNGPPQCQSVPRGYARFWGCPNLLERLQFGMEMRLFQDIKNSPHWTGTEKDLMNVLSPHLLQTPGEFPIRDAIDWVYSSIFITIKAMKFSKLPAVCGGPIEVAVITTDRPFRWVCHKSLSDAITLSSGV